MPKYIDAELLKVAMVFNPKLGDLTVPEMRDILTEIDSTPAADVEPKRRWIPVTERLPDTNDQVLVYVFDPDFYAPYIDFGYWVKSVEQWWEFNDEVGDFKYLTIIAWMPLPSTEGIGVPYFHEPPKGEENVEL